MAVRIIGGGLAGSEAAWQLVKRGIPVQLFEMRPQTMTKAHRTGKFAELVCSNSLRGAELSQAVGLLKEELRRLGSLIMEAADFSAVPAGGALAVDREMFSSYIDKTLREHPLFSVITDEVKEIPPTSNANPLIVCTGPLTSKNLATAIEQITGQGSLAFFDAISPIIFDESIDHTKVFRQSRYDKGSGKDYLNIGLSKEQYYNFIDEVERAEKYGGHEEVESDSIENLRPFEGCMPIEEMISRGQDTLLFGPLKPVGLCDPNTGKQPFAVIQLRQDDKAGKLWSMVGLQTRLKQGEQLRIFRTLPGLEQAEFVRLGSVHRNTFMDSPKCLKPTLEFRAKEGLLFAGQITGVEGYVESTASGLLAGINAGRLYKNQEPLTFPLETAIGALIGYVSEPTRVNFQPMNISFGLMPCYLEADVRDPRGKKIPKRNRRIETANRALEMITNWNNTNA